MANILILGVNYSWGDLSLILFGVPLSGVGGVEVKAKQDKKNNYAIGNQPVSRGRGRIEYEASLKGVYLDELRPIRAAAPNGSLLQIAPQNIKLLLVSTNGIPVIITLKNAEFLEDPFSATAGDTKLVVDIPLIISGIDYR